MTSKKHILLLGPAYPYRGGLAAFNERLAYALQEQGYLVTLITFSLQYPDFLFPGKTQFSKDAPPQGLSIRRQINAINPWNWLRVGWALRRERADLCIAAFWLPFMGPALGTILRLLGRSTTRIGLIHNIIPHEKRPGDWWLAKYFTGAIDAALCLSDAVQRDLARFTSVPSAVSPHPVYDSYGEPIDQGEARQRLGLEPTGRYLLFFGFIRAYKGLDLLLEAMADPRLRAAGVRLIVAGEYYGNELAYEQQIEQLGIGDLLEKHTHFIPNQAVKDYFCAADLVVQPYRSATQSGISQLAYHFERPMIVTRVGGLAEIVPHGVAGYVVDQQPAAIAEAVVDFYENKRADHFRAGVLAAKQRYSWASLVDRLQALLHEVTP
ncbi:MAG: glycosyltransferase [Bacteroidetes bacterium]|nr:MAG: glycosyltransferase [Bacteroidota bacterium]